MLKNGALVAKIGVDTDENKPRKRKNGRPIYRGPVSTCNYARRTRNYA